MWCVPTVLEFRGKCLYLHCFHIYFVDWFYVFRASLRNGAFSCCVLLCAFLFVVCILMPIFALVFKLVLDNIT